MATTNLISKSLGDILTESGNGAPDHTSPLGSIYSDKDTGNVWKNLNGTTTWELLSTVAYGEAYYQVNTTDTTISTQNVWASVGNTFTEGLAKGLSASTNTLVLIAGYDGDYEVRGNATISYSVGAANYEVGLSVNGADPVAGTYGGAYIDATQTRQHIGFQTIVSLTGGDTIGFDVRNLDSTANLDIRHAQLLARKVG
jgi:hypothetical protein